MHQAAISRPKALIVAHVLLLLAERPRHGYELAESLRASEFEGVTTSTVYRELAKLEEEGLVRSFWQASQARGPARHMYELTEAGHAGLVECAEGARDLMGHLTEFVARCGLVPPPPAAPPAVKTRPPAPPPPPAPAPAAPEPAVHGLARRWRSR